MKQNNEKCEILVHYEAKNDTYIHLYIVPGNILDFGSKKINPFTRMKIQETY